MTFGKEKHRSPAYCIRFYLTSSRKATVPWRSPCYCSNGTRIWRVQNPPSSLFERVFSPWIKWLPTSNTIFLLPVSTITLSGCIELGFWGRYFRHVNRYPFIIWIFALQFLWKIGKISISNNQGYLEGLSEKQEQVFLFCCFLLHSEWSKITKTFNNICCPFYHFCFTSGIPELQHKNQYYFTFILPYTHLFEGLQLQHDTSGEFYGELPVTLYQKRGWCFYWKANRKIGVFSLMKGWRSSGKVFLTQEALQYKTSLFCCATV